MHIILLNQECTWFLEIDLVREVCVSVCLPPRLVITSGVMWRDMDPYDWLNKYYSFFMAAIVGIISRRGFRIKAHHRNQPNKSKLVLYKPLIRLYRHSKQPYISNKTNASVIKVCVVCVGVHVSRRLKEELAWATYNI